MVKDRDVPEEELADAVARAKRDGEFMMLLAQHVERDREIHDRLADS